MELGLKNESTDSEVNMETKEKFLIHGKREYNTTITYIERINSLLEKKEYHHWNSIEEEENNKKLIRNYNQKKRAIDKESLLTQKSILTQYNELFNQENIARMNRELGSNKIELYNVSYFYENKDSHMPGYQTLGVREGHEGRICVCDNEDIGRLQHVSAHETMHDLSFQNLEHESNTEILLNGDIVTRSCSVQTSGIHKFEKKEQFVNGKSENIEVLELNRSLNEGITEMYTIEDMLSRGECPSFDCYTQEVGWAINLREKLGNEVIADAYFGGNIDEFKSKIEIMSSFENAWDILNENINWYHRTGNMDYKNMVDEIIDSLDDRSVNDELEKIR